MYLEKQEHNIIFLNAQIKLILGIALTHLIIIEWYEVNAY